MAKRKLALLAASAASICAMPARAALTYDLRFSDGTKQKDLSASSGPFTIELWGQVSGTNGSVTDESIEQSYVVLQSTEVTGDLFDGALASGIALAPYNGTGYRNGTANNLTNDGVGDWGSNSNLIANAGYMFCRADTSVNGGGTVGQSVNANTWEFRLATFTLNITSVHPIGANDQTNIAIVKPAATSFSGVTYASSRQDGVTHYVTSTSFAGVYGSSISLIASSGSTWDGGPSATGNSWTDPVNWSGDAVPGPFQSASFAAAGTASTINLPLGAGGSQQVGKIDLTASANRDITIAVPTGQSGTLIVNGVGGALLANNSATHDLEFAGGSSHPLLLQLGAGSIYVADPSRHIRITDSLTSSAAITKTGPGTLRVKNITASSLTISAGKVTIDANGDTTGVCYVNDLSIAPTAALDLNDNDLVVNYGSAPNAFARIQQLVIDGFALGPDPTKTGIISTTGQTIEGKAILALFDNALIGTGDWPPGSGRTISTNSIVGKYTYFGDLNFDGQVTGDDYPTIDSNLGEGSSSPLSPSPGTPGEGRGEGFIPEPAILIILPTFPIISRLARPRRRRTGFFLPPPPKPAK